MVASVKIQIKHGDGIIEKDIAKNLTEYQAKRLFRLCQCVIKRGHYDTFERYEKVIDAIDKIVTGYHFEVYPLSEDFVEKLELKTESKLKSDKDNRDKTYVIIDSEYEQMVKETLCGDKNDINV